MNSTDHRHMLRPGFVAGATVLALILTGCNGGDNGDSPETQTQPSAPEQTASPETQETDNDDDADSAAEDSSGVFASTELSDVAGNSVGSVSFAETDTGVQIDAEVHDVPPGFRGLTIYETGLCEPQSLNSLGEVGDFFSAGDHLAGDPAEDQGVVEGEDDLESPTPIEGQGLEGEQSEVVHPDHAGDLPNILVNSDGAGVLSLVTDRLTPEILLDEGRAIILHSTPDHHGGIPERYAPYGVDQQSLMGGDSGSRTACGVIEEAN